MTYVLLSFSVFDLMYCKSISSGENSLATSDLKALQWSRIGGLFEANLVGMNQPNLKLKRF